MRKKNCNRAPTKSQEEKRDSKIEERVSVRFENEEKKSNVKI